MHLNDIGFRVSYASWMFYLPVMTLMQPFSLTQKAVQFEGVGSYPLFILTIVVGVLMICDVFCQVSECNHLKCAWAWLADQRFALYGIGALCFISVPFLAVRGSNTNEFGTYFYVLIFIKGCWLMWVDAAAKKKKKRGTRATSA